MAKPPTNPAAAVELTLATFEKLVRYFVLQADEKQLKPQIEAAWYELLKGDAADAAVVELALAAARSASDTSAHRMRLEKLFSSTRRPTKRKTAKEPSAPHGRKTKARRKTAK